MSFNDHPGAAAVCAGGPALIGFTPMTLPVAP